MWNHPVMVMAECSNLAVFARIREASLVWYVFGLMEVEK
jgi:hypothetical protein